jgi:hypothetical protein
VAIFVAEVYTRRIKRIEATLKFTKRFQELIGKQHALNSEFYYDANGNLHDNTPDVLAKNELDAWNFLCRVFDLLLNEFNYCRVWLVRKQDFVGWMEWRWYDWEPEKRYGKQENRPGGLPEGLTTCGISYQKGWELPKRVGPR